ncbi:c-type cytochrome [Pseudofulvibacter geojedonensis]|uniref:C-type cytochrome n=1 Tax=Pseudofulvibacter geojedonensis TaxID=1123758 RepID=A0ABW3I028_9FLAO
MKRDNLGCGVDDSDVFICGTRPKLDSKEARNGKQLFYANCAACHKIDKHMTGPALRNMASLYKENKLSLESFLKGNRDTLLFEKEFDNQKCMLFSNFSNGDVYDLVLYLEKI